MVEQQTLGYIEEAVGGGGGWGGGGWRNAYRMWTDSKQTNFLSGKVFDVSVHFDFPRETNEEETEMQKERLCQGHNWITSRESAGSEAGKGGACIR